MTVTAAIQVEGPKVWRLGLPDWSALDSLWRRDLPFALWTVGEQSLLFHWLDAAVDHGMEKVVLTVVDRPLAVRQHIADALLWPIQIEVRSAAALDSSSLDALVDCLPGVPPPATAPVDAWSLIEYWFELEQAWLIRFTQETASFGDFAAIGRHCMIAPEVTLLPPYWIGDFVSIGPGCVVGPHAVVSNGSVLAGGNRIERAHVGSYTYLGPHTDLLDAVMQGNELTNLKRRAHVKQLESFVAAGLKPTAVTAPKPSLRDRWLALRLYLNWTRFGFSSDSTFTDCQGHDRPVLADSSIHARRPWLKEVVLGRMLLFGIAPRPSAAIVELPQEWQSLLRQAPVGALSYADVMGEDEIGSEAEVLHALFQAGGDAAHCRQLFEAWIVNWITEETQK